MEAGGTDSLGSEVVAAAESLVREPAVSDVVVGMDASLENAVVPTLGATVEYPTKGIDVVVLMLILVEQGADLSPGNETVERICTHPNHCEAE